MLLVSTLCSSRAIALKILRDVPDNSIVLLPETVSFLSTTLKPYSIKKNLFIIFNNDVVVNGKKFIAMRSINKGEYQWTVKKSKLWHTDLKAGYSASEPEPIVDIRGFRSALFICNDFSSIYKMTDILIKNKVEIIMLTSNWQYNYEFITEGMSYCLKYIPTLKYCMFSNTNTLSFIKTKTKEKRIKGTGYVELRL